MWRSSMNPIQELKSTINAAELLADWLGGTSSPVHEMVAEFRSQRCTVGNNGQSCPLNVEPNWWDRVKHSIADWIRGELELKHNMGLKVSCEEQLNMCRVCGCCLRLKVWTPADVLRKHVQPKKGVEVPEWCWMKKESIL